MAREPQRSLISVIQAATIALAVIAAVAPAPAALVERLYSSTIYPAWQRGATTVSNVVPFAALDAFILLVVAVWLALLVRDVMRRRAYGGLRTTLRIAVRTTVWAAAIYLVFLASWGLNYRRMRLLEKLEVDSSRVSREQARALASDAVRRLNTMYEAAHRATDAPTVDAALAEGLKEGLQAVGTPSPPVPGRPKRSLLDLYFRRAGVDGMTDPIFLETLVASDLLEVERPFVVAHEWAHLAGYADEGEANFIGWLACLRGTTAHQYSAWLFLFEELAGTLPPADRRAVAAPLAEGPRADLTAIADRAARNRSVRIATAGWRVYNRYLKANRIESGTASYGEVVRLILGTKFNPLGGL